jgi:hypothetical protein
LKPGRVYLAALNENSHRPVTIIRELREVRGNRATSKPRPKQATKAPRLTLAEFLRHIYERQPTIKPAALNKFCEALAR